MARIFISYRRDDSRWAATRLYDALCAHFGEPEVFLDPDINAGDDYRETVDEKLAECRVLIAVIGRQWLTITDASGHRRLDDPGDLVCHEVATGLECGVRVIPFLVDGVGMPREEELPARLKDLPARNSFETTERHFHQNLAELFSVIERELGDTPRVDSRDGLTELLLDYARAVVERYEERRARHPRDLQRNLLDFYIEARGAPEPPARNGGERVEGRALWSLLEPSVERGAPSAVLAEFGMGKTWLLETILYRLARRALESGSGNGGDARFPLWVSLRGVRLDGDAGGAGGGLAGLLGSRPRAAFEHLRRHAWVAALGETAVSSFEEALVARFEEGRFVFLLDALDEMVVRSMKERDLLLVELGGLSEHRRRSAIVLTSRRSLFTDVSQERRLGDLGFDVYYLWPWARSDILAYLRRVHEAGLLPGEPEPMLERIEGTYDLRDIAGRAMLSAMLVDQWEELARGGAVDLPSLYDRHIEKAILNWQAPKAWQLQKHEIRQVMEEIAFLMFELDSLTVKPEELDEYLERRFEHAGIQRFSTVAESFVRDVKSNSFLLRERDDYAFCHTSIWEFLVARRLLRGLENEDPAVFQVASRAVKYQPVLKHFLLPMLRQGGRMDLVSRVFGARPA